MGIDISSDSGVIATVKQVLKCVNTKNKSAIIDVCNLYYKEHTLNVYSDEDSLELFSPLRDCHQMMRLCQVREALASTVVVEGEPSKYATCRVKESDWVTNLFQKVLDAAGHDLPYLKEVTAFGSNRYNGYDVPLGVACFVFDDNDCFTRKLSSSGKRLEKIIGHCEVTEWTEYSV